MKQTISLTVNDRELSVEVQPGKTLLDFLRGDLRLTGTKESCRQGECGACSVLLDGRAVNACMVYLQGLDGCRVVTIEGLADGDAPDPIQQAFVDHGAIQCGFCTPGAIIAAKSLLLQNPHPTEEEVKQGMSGNLCRCTGYRKIIDAVLAAAGGGGTRTSDTPSDFAVIGRRAPRQDAMSKALGRAKYADDLDIPGLLIARAKRSEYPHARIKGMEVSRAVKSPGVVAVLTADDIPGLGYCGQVFKDMPVIAGDKVRSVGDPVAVVVAETREQAEAARELIRVDYEELPVIRTIEEALAPDAPQLHQSGNLRQEFGVQRGDVAAAFAGCAVVVEETVSTQLSEHAFIETECSVAYIDGETGLLTVCSPTQEVYSDRRQVAASLALPQNQVRIIQTVTGGAFGGKIDVSTEIVAALCAYKTGRPVKYRYDRVESMAAATKRHPIRTTIKLGADAQGKLQALQATVYIDNGSYASMGAKVAQKNALSLCGPYVIPNVDIKSYLVYTNSIFGGAMRGFGVPQAAFAHETAMELLAHKLGMDSWELRHKNATTPGAVNSGGQVLRTANIRAHLEAAKAYLEAHPLPARAGGDGQ